MLDLKSRVVACKCKHPHRIARAGGAGGRAGGRSPMPAVTIARPSAGAPRVRRTICESDEALNVALDRMIDQVLRARRASIPR